MDNTRLVDDILTVAYNGGMPAAILIVLIAIIVLVAAQQTVMVVRAYLRLGFWGAELTAYRTLGQPEWCHPKNVKELTGNAVASGVPVSHAELDTPQ